MALIAWPCCRPAAVRYCIMFSEDVMCSDKRSEGGGVGRGSEGQHRDVRRSSLHVKVKSSS